MQDVLSYHVSTNTVYDEFYKYVINNLWINYFLNNPMYQKENWIDFESEISLMIQSVDSDMLDNNLTLEDKIKSLTNVFLNKRFKDWFAEKTYKELRNVLLYDLHRLNRALEIYLTEYVEKIVKQKKSPDIDSLKIDNVLSFNYTDTFEKIYRNSKKIEYDYIHGKADIFHTIDSNNMVLGIDEYLPEDRRNKETEFIAFKKFYQRIYKQTGSEYKDWIDIIIQENDSYIENIRQQQIDYDKNRGMSYEGARTRQKLQQLKNNPPKHNLYIFGHSLDITDKDILRDLILNYNVYTTIYYQNKEELGRKISNLVKVIGQDELVRRTGGSTKTIEFKQQQDMVEIKS